MLGWTIHQRWMLTCLVAGSLAGLRAAEAQDKGVGVEAVKAVEKLGAARYAVIIGINQYADKSIPELHFAEADAQALYDTLTDSQVGGIEPKNAVLLLGKDATKRNICKALTDLRTIPKDATVFIFFSGHGAKEAGEAFWVTADSELGGLAFSAIPDREVRALTERIPSNRLIMLLDCCYAAATVKEQKSVVDITEALKSFVGKGRVTITASGNGDEAIEADDLKHGVFAHFLLEALKGAADGQGGPADGIVTVPELTSYIDRHVADAARQRKGIQKPNIFMEEVQDPGKFLVTIDPKRIADLAEAALRESALVKSRIEALKKLLVDDAVTAEQFQLGKRLLGEDPARLDEQDRERLDYFIELVTGKIPAKRLQALLDSVETPQQRAARLERERLAALAAATLGKLDAAFAKKDATEAYRLFDEVKKLSPGHASIAEWTKKLEQLRPPWMAFFPMTAEQAERVQREAARNSGLSPELTLDCGDGVTLELVLIPAGTFTMGSNEDDAEKPPHQVTISRPFYMGKYEVTQAQWQAVMGSNPSDFKGDDLPAETVSWDDCQEFCKKLSAKTGKTVRLPTEAEWEYACRAGTTTPFSFGETISTDQANYDGNDTYGNGRKGQYRQKTTSVGSFAANAWGLYDMHGNVWEWCEDWYDRYPGSSATSDDFGQTYRVLRGGCWGDNPRYCRAANRYRYTPDYRGVPSGLRVVVGTQ